MIRASILGFLVGAVLTVLVCLGIVVMDADMDEDIWADK